MSLYLQLSDAIYHGDRVLAMSLVHKMLRVQLPPDKVLSDGLLHGMQRISHSYKREEIFVPQVLLSARAMNNSMRKLSPALKKHKIMPSSAGTKVVLGTVEGDLHDVGKNLVRLLMQAQGVRVIDLGVNVSAETFVQTAVEEQAQLIGCSALLTTTMPVMKEVADALHEYGVQEHIRLIVGGAPVSQHFADTIGADYYTENAVDASNLVVGYIKNVI